MRLTDTTVRRTTSPGIRTRARAARTRAVVKVFPFTTSSLPQQQHSSNCHWLPLASLTAEYPSPCRPRQRQRQRWQGERPPLPHVPPSGDGAPTPLDAGDRSVQPLQEGLARNPLAFRLASRGFRGDADRLDLSMPIDRTSPPECNLPFDPTAKYLAFQNGGAAYYLATHSPQRLDH